MRLLALIALLASATLSYAQVPGSATGTSGGAGGGSSSTVPASGVQPGALNSGVTIGSSQVVSNPAYNTYFSLVQATGGADVYQSNTTAILTTCFSLLCTGPANGAKSYVANTRFAQQYSFGDSITYGYSASAPYNGYPYWLAAAVNLPDKSVVNNGNIGYQSGQLDPVIFTQSYSYQPTSLITYLIGTNNVNNYANDTNHEADFLVNVEAQLAWWLFPSASKIPFGTGSVTYTGTWTNDSLIGKQTSGSAATATFTGTGNTLYLVTEVTGSTAGTATLACDGSATGATLRFAFNGGNTGYNQTAMTRVSGLSAGAHTCVVTTGSSGLVTLEWATFFTSGTNGGTPTVVFGGVPNQNTANSTTIAAIAAYRTQAQSAVSLLESDGFVNLVYADTSAVGGIANSQYYNDQYHFTDQGYYLLAQPFITALNTLLSSSYSDGLFIPRPLANFAATGQNSLCLGYTTCGTNGSGVSATFNGTRVTGIGTNALGAAATTPYDVVAINFNALLNCSTCSLDVAIGSQSMQNSATILRSVGIGYATLYSAQAGASDDTAVGSSACQNGSAALTGLTCVGSSAGYADTANYNSFIGAGAGNTGTAITSDTEITFVGYQTGKSTATILNDAGAFGYQATANASGAYEIGPGTNAVGNTLDFHAITIFGKGAFSTAPTCNSATEGASWAFTDSTTTTFAATIAGSGSSHIRGYCNGSNWIVG